MNKLISYVFLLGSRLSEICKVCFFGRRKQSGPALSRCNRCSCIGPRAMVFGQIIHFCQIHLPLENSVETPYKFHC